MKGSTMRRLRQLHQYLGVFFAPMILLFAVSGALQTFRLQEEKGYGGVPPSWIVWMASIHKDQAAPRQAAKSANPLAEHPKSEARGAAPAKPVATSRRSTLPLKIFVTLLALALIGSTIIGVIIALNNRLVRRTVMFLLAAGVIGPILLLKI
jgi:uncharacterized iron-regulated membrane protein